MLLYHNGKHRRHLVQILGSMFYRRHVFALGFFVAAMVSALQVLEERIDMHFTLPHQYPHQMLGGIVTFAVVFRINQSWSRYWESVTNLHIMYSKWADSFSQFCAFISVSIQRRREREESDVVEKVALLEDMREKVENDFLLLSAMACDRICRGDCAQMQRRHELRSGNKTKEQAERITWNSLVVLREDLRKGDDLTKTKGMPEFVQTKTSRTDIVDDEDLDDVEIKSLWDPQYVVKKVPKDAKYELLKVSSDRCNMVVNWLNHNLAYCGSMLETPAPIQSRMYQEISNGMLGFNNVMKIADVPFPFAVDQLILVLLVIWTFSVPFFIITFTESWIAGPLFGFVSTTLMFSMNDTARELENPFGLTPNKICVPEFHSRFALVVRDAVRSSNNPPRPPKANVRPSQKFRYTSYSTETRQTTTTVKTGEFHELSSVSSSLEPPPKKRSYDASLFLREPVVLQSRVTKVSNPQSRVSFLSEPDTDQIEDSIDAMEIVTKLSIESNGKETNPSASPPSSPRAVQSIKSNGKSSQHVVESSLGYTELVEAPRISPPCDATFATANDAGMHSMFHQLAQVSERVEQQLNTFSSQLKNISASAAQSSQSRLLSDDPVAMSFHRRVYL